MPVNHLAPPNANALTSMGMQGGITPAATGDYYRYNVREKLFPGEDIYFKNNPHVAGMAAEDGRIIFNPYSRLSSKERHAVGRNEGARLFMRENGIVPDFVLNKKQREFFKGTKYETDEEAMKQTIFARYISGDPSANLDKSQLAEAERIKQLLNAQRNSAPMDK